MTPKRSKLSLAAARHRAVANRADVARLERDDAIEEAYDAKMPLREIARQTELDPSNVLRLLRRRKRSS
jgi:hypothetical protein